MKVHDTTPVLTDYNVAAATCSGEGGHLFDMLTSQDEDGLTVYLGQQTGLLSHFLYLGARKSGGDFHWTDGSLMSKSSPFWDINQPNLIDENCVAIRIPTGKLHDIGCHSFTSPFVCQIDLYGC
ncbi:hypothetical protein V1264_000635 [Littorina saxatilis]|uniref:C-type lectin domain-containing protein n=1 Tax=Littorina saxatilis TaxID=31220 RepID=A0AAN9C0D8_9CAEN